MSIPAYVYCLDRICRIAKYVFLAPTTATSIYGQLNETTLKTWEPLKPKALQIGIDLGSLKVQHEYDLVLDHIKPNDFCDGADLFYGRRPCARSLTRGIEG